MEQITFSVRMDSVLKKQLDKYCQDFGMNTSTAINVFARAVVREKKIPFEIYSDRDGLTRETGKQAFDLLRNEAKEKGIQGMSDKDINLEIAATRKARKEKNGEAV